MEEESLLISFVEKFGVEPFKKFLRYLDGRSQARLFATCKYFWDSKQLRTGWVDELRNFLQQPVHGPFSAASEFGNAGLLEVMNFVPTDALRAAFGFLLAQHPEAGPTLNLLLYHYFLPVKALLNCRVFCALSSELRGEEPQEADLQLMFQWRPLPAVMFVLLSVLDVYLVSKRIPPLGLPLEPSQSPSLLLDVAIRDGKEQIRDLIEGGMAAYVALDTVLARTLHVSAHPRFSFEDAVLVLHSLVSEYLEFYIEPPMYGNASEIIIKQGGFYTSAIDGRVHWFPISRLREWVVENADQFPAGLKDALERTLLEMRKEREKENAKELVCDLMLFQDKTPDKSGPLARSLCEPLYRLMFGSSGFVGKYG